MMTTQCERCFSSLFEPHMLGFRNAVLSCAFCKDSPPVAKHFFQKDIADRGPSLLVAQMSVTQSRERREIP